MDRFEQDPKDAGLVDDASYTSPQYGYDITWSNDWQVDTYYDDPQNSCAGPAVSSDADSEIDTIFLIWTDDDRAAYAQLSGTACPCKGPRDFVDTWTSDAMIAEQWGDDGAYDVTVLDDDIDGDSGAVLYSVVDTKNDSVLYTMQQYTELPDGTVFRIKFSSPDPQAIDAYESLGDDIEMDGDPLTLVFSPDDIEDAID